MYINSLSQGPQAAQQLSTLNTQGAMQGQALSPSMQSMGMAMPPGISGGDSQQNLVSTILQFASGVINTLVGLISQLMGGNPAGASIPQGTAQEGRAGAASTAGGFSLDGLLSKAGDLFGGLFGSKGSEGKEGGAATKGTGGGIVDGILGLFGGGSGGGSGGGFLGKIGSFIGSFF
jgi:hypothetical protein